MRKRYLIVDGYNVIRSGSRYRDIELPDYTDDRFNAARELLLKDVADFIGRRMEAAIVYDGADRVGAPSPVETAGLIRIMFTSRGQSADNLIERLAHDAKERGFETLVVTSDATIQETVYGCGVDRMSAEGFCQEIEMDEIARRESETPEVSRKRTIAERIPSDVLEKLKSMRDGV